MTLDGACQVAKAACEQLATWDLELAVATAARAVKRLERVPVSPPHGSPGTQAEARRRTRATVLCPEGLGGPAEPIFERVRTRGGRQRRRRRPLTNGAPAQCALML